MSEVNTKIAIITDQIDQDLEKACAKIKLEGYTAVELHNVFGKSIEECGEEETLKIKTIIDAYGLKVINLASTIFFLCPLYSHYQVSLFNPNFHAFKGSVKEHLNNLHNACHMANILQCETIRIFPFRFPDNEEVTIVGTKKDQDEIIKYFKKAVEIATLYNIILVVENCPYSHCPKGEMTYHIVKEINDPHLKLLWDPANSYRADKHRVPQEYLKRTLSQEYELIKSEIRHVHLKNYTYDEIQVKPFVHKALLEGDIDYHALLHTMRSEYPYSYSLEPEVDEEKTIQSMKELKSCLH